MTLESKPRTIVDGKYISTSPSQIQTFKACKRKWAFDKFWGVKRPDTESTLRGKKIHKALELYALGKEYDSEMEPYVMAVKNYITRPHLGVEVEIKMPTFDGGPYMVGVIDRVEQSTLVDYKTLSDLRYAATPQALLDSTQMNTYGWWYYLHNDDKEWIEYIHLNIHVKKGATPKTSPVNTTTNYDQVKKVWERDMGTVREMQNLVTSCYQPAKNDDHIDELATRIEPTVSHCTEYGGCFYRSRCGLSPESPLTMKWLKKPAVTDVKKEFTSNDVQPDVQGKSMSLKDKLLAQQAAKSAAAPTNGVATTQAQPTGPSLEEKLAKNAPVAEEISALDSKLAALAIDVEALPDTTATVQIVSIVPPDATPDAVDGAALAATTTMIVDPPAKKPVGRPKKNAEAAAPQAEGLCLYIDAFPVKGPHKNSYVLAEDWLKPIAEQVAADTGVADWRLIQFTAKPQLAIAIRARLTELPASMVVMTFAAGSDVLLECLIPYAVQVIRGK